MSSRLTSMSVPRPIAIIALLLLSCTGWKDPPQVGAPSPDLPLAPSPDLPPAPSSYTPPSPVELAHTPPNPTPPAPATFRVAIASAHLLTDCPDPAPLPDPARLSDPEHAGPRPPQMRGDSTDEQRFACSQSSVQLAIRSDIAAPFRVEAVRIIDARSDKVTATALVRSPNVWSPEGIYRAWDEHLPAGLDLKVSYKLGDPLSLPAGTPTSFRSYGTLVLEMDVSVGGHRRTLRSAEFAPPPAQIMVT